MLSEGLAMKISLTTFEQRVRQWLLDLLHSQWCALGIPFSISQPLRSHEVLDPEALLWCSLEFFPTQPRLREQVMVWRKTHAQYLNRPRIQKLVREGGDPRASIWHVLDAAKRAHPGRPEEACYGLDSVDDVLRFCEDLRRDVRRVPPGGPQAGQPSPGPSSLVLRARDLLGNDARHFLLVYLLANPGGAKLRAVANWSGHSYRNIAKVAQRWQAVQAVWLEHGFCRLKNVDQWRALLALQEDAIALVNWRRFFDVCIHLLRALAKAGRKALTLDSVVVAALVRDAADASAECREGDWSSDAPSLQHLRDLLLLRG